MNNRRCFVQFPHPGGERDRVLGSMWSPHRIRGRCIKHARQFMEFPGGWTDKHGATHSTDLWAWGEWEPESTLLREFDQAGDRRLPVRLWSPCYEPRDEYLELHNTDPLIFGGPFLYSNCRQPRSTRRSGLMHLARGSIVVFGSPFEREQEWVVDTVLVVAGSRRYHAGSMDEDLADLHLPDAFMDVTGQPIIQNERPDLPLRLYLGATPEAPVDEMFSFFPAVPAAEEWAFPRPPITLPDEFFKVAQSRGPMGHALGGPNLSSETLRGLWQCIVDQVREAGLVLGTRAQLPERSG